MKTVKFYLMRHGKNTKELEATLPLAELNRAMEIGGSIKELFTKVFYSPLARAIQTAMAVVVGNNSHPNMMEVVKELGNSELFGAMTAPSQFRSIASAKGNYMALYDVHELDQIKDWRFDIVNAFYGMFLLCRNSDVALVSFHSPTLEMLVDGLLLKQEEQLPENLSTMAELEYVIVEASQRGEGGFINIRILGKNTP